MKMADTMWQTARYHASVIPISDDGQQIEAIVAGQQRLTTEDGTRLQPLVIIEASLGSVAEEHVVIAQLVASFARVLRYNRTGYGRSTLGSHDRSLTATTRANELSLLLHAIGLPPPYILVGHSYGGTLIRAFLEARGRQEVVGMIFIDAVPFFHSAIKLMDSKILPTLIGRGGEEAALKANGLFYNAVLTPQQDEDRKTATIAAEESGAEEKERLATEQSVAVVNEAQGIHLSKDDDGFVTDISFTKQPFDGRLSVILGDFPRDLEAVIEHGKTYRHGDAGTYETAAESLDIAKRTHWKFQKAMTQLTTGESRVRTADGTGRTHNLHVTRPDIVAEEVRWVMEGVWDLGRHQYWPTNRP